MIIITTALYRFTSKELHEASGLVYYLYRFYDPNLQRWPNRDPLDELGGFNLYQFIQNSPLNYIDALGLCGQLFPFKEGPNGPSERFRQYNKAQKEQKEDGINLDDAKKFLVKALKSQSKNKSGELRDFLDDAKAYQKRNRDWLIPLEAAGAIGYGAYQVLGNDSKLSGDYTFKNVGGNPNISIKVEGFFQPKTEEKQMNFGFGASLNVSLGAQKEPN